MKIVCNKQSIKLISILIVFPSAHLQEVRNKNMKKKLLHTHSKKRKKICF